MTPKTKLAWWLERERRERAERDFDDALASPAATSWRGEWDSATAYAPNDSVRRNGCGYVAVANNSGVDPATDNGTHWKFVGELA